MLLAQEARHGELHEGLGGRMGLGVYSNMELRDQKVAFFISHMPQGTRTLTYRLRAEIPGQFHVLPTNGYAMYAPDIRARQSLAAMRERGTPSMRIAPDAGSYILASSFTNVVLPAPFSPTIATTAPAGKISETSSNTKREVPG